MTKANKYIEAACKQIHAELMSVRFIPVIWSNEMCGSDGGWTVEIRLWGHSGTMFCVGTNYEDVCNDIIRKGEEQVQTFRINYPVIAEHIELDFVV